MVGNKKLHENVVMMACGNLATDGAIVNNLSTALQSRMIHFQLAFDSAAWFSWANRTQIDMRIVGYLNWRPENMHNFNPNHNDKTYPCGRTWEFMHRIINDWKTIEHSKLPILCGTVGQGVGTEFFGFCKLYHNLPSLQMMLASPDTVAIDTTDMGVMFALCSVIEANIDTTNADKLIILVERMPPEFQVVCLQQVCSNKPSIVAVPAIAKWVTNHASDLLVSSR
jgi:hypothetical protein